jgi:hypothetical protein
MRVAMDEVGAEAGSGPEGRPGTRNEENFGTAKPPKRKRKLSRLSKWLLWMSAVVLVLAVAVGGAILHLLNRAEPMLRASLIDTLQKRFQAHVELDNMHVSAVDGFRVEASGLRIWLPAAVQAQSASRGSVTDPTGKSDAERAAQTQRHTEPWILVDKMWFRTAGRILPGKPIEVSVIHVEGVRVVLPPKDERPQMSLPGNRLDRAADQSKPVEAPAGSQGGAQPEQGTTASLFKMPTILVRRIECKDATLLIERKQEPGKAKVPLDFEFARVTLVPDGHGGPIAFDVNMTNARPIGKIHSTGHLGPWVAGDPRTLPVDGDYSFDHADLGTIKGIAGILSSTGHYSGTLSQIEANGQTHTPDFRLERVHKGSGVLLTTRFHAIVDGTNGNVWLQPVDGMLGHTHILARGKVLRADDVIPGAKGHDIVLDVTVDRGRIEDILQIAADADQPFVTGKLTLKSNFHLPPGKESVWDKLLLDGQFHLSNAQFSSESMQGKIVQLSLRGQGKPKDVKTTDPTTVLSEMEGHFKLGDGKLQLPDLDYQVPGAEIVAHGVYGLQGGTLAFEGNARLDASLSKVVGGWKGFLLKPADRYLRKNGAGTDLPIHVEGTRKEPKFGVDFGRLGKTEKTENAGDPK